jgi:predicted Zn finger-like uncharacterized protein
VIIECPACHSKYQYDEERFERKPSKKIKCARCQQIFEIHNPAFAEKKPAATANDSTAAKHEATRTSRPAPPPPEEATTESSIPQKDTGRLVAPQLPVGRRLSLAILEGPDAGNVYRIEKPRVTIGRSGADLTINDTEASRQHAAVEVRDTQYTLTDLGSTNGTMYDGQKIQDPVELQNHSEFVIGSTTLMFIVTEDA